MEDRQHQVNEEINRVEYESKMTEYYIRMHENQEKSKILP